MQQDNIISIMQQNSFIKTAKAEYNIHKIFIDDEIVEPKEYRDLIDLLFTSSESDEFFFYFNSSGGNLSSAESIIEGIKSTPADVTGVIIGNCHSAASAIALNCHKIIVLDSASMMVHTAYITSEGLTGNMRMYSEFINRKIEKYLHETYRGFLSDDEIEQVKTGLEIWLDADDIRRRIELRNEYHKQFAETEQTEA